jgi:hypothetical protein
MACILLWPEQTTIYNEELLSLRARLELNCELVLMHAAKSGYLSFLFASSDSLTQSFIQSSLVLIHSFIISNWTRFSLLPNASV